MANNTDQFNLARNLIKQKQYDAARSILEKLPNDPKAKQWLEQLDKLASSKPTTDVLSAKEQLLKAKDLIAQEHYDAARAILNKLENNPTATKWLSKLDEIAPEILFPEVKPTLAAKAGGLLSQLSTKAVLIGAAVTGLLVIPGIVLAIALSSGNSQSNQPTEATDIESSNNSASSDDIPENSNDTFPDGARNAITEEMESKTFYSLLYVIPSEWNTTTAIKAPDHENNEGISMRNVEEAWCVTIDPPLKKELFVRGQFYLDDLETRQYYSFYVYRVGSLWKAVGGDTDTIEALFQRANCPNYRDEESIFSPPPTPASFFSSPTQVTSQNPTRQGPDFINLQFLTVPNILQVELVKSEPTDSGVVGTFNISNPLQTLYLSYVLSGSYESLELIQQVPTDQVWHNIRILPPGGELTYQITFSSTNDSLSINSPLMSLRALTFNFAEVAGNYLVGSIEASKIATVFGEVFLDFENRLLSITANMNCFDQPTIADLSRCIDLTKDIFGNEVFAEMMVQILTKLGFEVGLTDIKLFDLIDKLGNISDSLVYIGLAMASGDLNNRYVLQPMTMDPTKLPPWPPRLNTPIGWISNLQPRLEWHSVPDVSGYEVQLAKEVDFLETHVSLSTDTTYLDLPVALESNTTYYWRVRALSPIEPRPWSTGSFTTIGDTELLSTIPSTENDNAINNDVRTLAFISIKQEETILSLIDTDSLSIYPLANLALNGNFGTFDDEYRLYRFFPHWKPRWSPDGNQIAFLSETLDSNASGGIAIDIYITNINEPRQSRITNTPNLHEILFQWSPDGMKMACAAYASGGDGYPENYVLNIDGTNMQKYNTSINDRGIFPHWSPDGEKIIFITDYVYLTDSTGNHKNRFFASFDFSYIYWETLRWSPDSSSIIFVKGSKTDQSSIYKASVDGINIVNITEDVLSSSYPEWSPDGKKIAFVANPDHIGFGSIYLMNADGSNLTRLTDLNMLEGTPVWSGDGNKIAFTAYDGSDLNTAEIYIIDSDGDNLQEITDNNYFDGVPSWRPH